MRRLPVYFLVDTSESADAERINQLLNQFLLGIRQDPYLLEVAYMSLITFSDNAKIELPLTENVKIESIPKFETRKGTGCSLTNVMRLLMDDIDKNVVKTTSERKGDWKPMILLLTNGAFIDSPTEVFARWNIVYSKRTHLITIYTNDIVNEPLLREISDAIVSCNDIKDKSSKFISWISFYDVEAPICSSEQEAKELFNKNLDNFLKYI